MRSNLHAAIRSLSFFADRCRKIIFRFPCFVILLCISSIALGSGRRRWQRDTKVYCRCNSLSQLFDCFTHGVVETVFALLVKSPLESGTDIGARQPEFYVIRFVGHRVLSAFR